MVISVILVIIVIIVLELATTPSTETAPTPIRSGSRPPATFWYPLLATSGR